MVIHLEQSCHGPSGQDMSKVVVFTQDQLEQGLQQDCFDKMAIIMMALVAETSAKRPFHFHSNLASCRLPEVNISILQ
eukprot:1161583-Pelagomonas_calceolata.AAC.1